MAEHGDRSERGDSGGFAKSASSDAFKGALLVGLAVLIGFVLLNVVDPGDIDETPEAGQGDTPTSKAATTTTTVPVASKSPEQLRIIVLNAGETAGAAGKMSEQLKAVSYTSQEDPADDLDKRVGNAVMCKEGFEAERTTLAIAVGTDTEQIETYSKPDNAPAKSRLRGPGRVFGQR